MIRVGRISYGVQRPDLLPLLRISRELLPVARAKTLFAHHITSAEELVATGSEALAQILVHSLPSHQRTILDVGGSTESNQDTTHTTLANATTSVGSSVGSKMSLEEEQLWQRSRALAQRIIARYFCRCVACFQYQSAFVKLATIVAWLATVSAILRFMDDLAFASHCWG